MAGEWAPVPFGELLTEPVRNGIYKPAEFHGRGAKIVNMGELFGHSRMGSVPMKRVELTESEQARFMVQAGDLLFARRSLTAEGAGKCSVVLEVGGPTTFESSIIRARPDQGRADPQFLYYFFSSPPGMHLLDTIRRHVAVAGITGADLSRLEIPLPPLVEQSRIVDILSTLDDKIGINRKMSEALEAMAQTLFKSWFVDFDPVQAKAEGRTTGLPKHIDELFPDSFEDSELGDLPGGWAATPVYELGTFINGAAYSAFEPNDDRVGLPIIKIAELKAGVTAQTRFSTVEMAERYRIGDGDLLFSWSGNPDTSIDTFVWGGGPAWLNQHIFRVVPHSPSERAFVLTALRFLRPTFAEVARNKQTTGLGHVTVEDLKRLRIVAPPQPVLFEWTRLAEPLLRRVEICQREAARLSAIRDRLLPALMTHDIHSMSAAEVVGGRQ